MSTKTQEALRTERALKLALEALEDYVEEYGPHEKDSGVAYAITAIREALAAVPDGADSALDRMAENARELGLDYKPDFVLPGGGHVPAVPVAVYGYCPECGGAGVMRERRPNGDDKCTNGHKYPSSKALVEQPAQQEPMAIGWQRRDGTLHRGCPPIGEDDGWTPLYTTPPRREWAGLTDEDLAGCDDEEFKQARYWEQVLQEKNA